jgi:hypothetical protein
VIDHGVVIRRLCRAGLPQAVRLGVRSQMHVSRVHPASPGCWAACHLVSFYRIAHRPSFIRFWVLNRLIQGFRSGSQDSTRRVADKNRKTFEVIGEAAGRQFS